MSFDVMAKLRAMLPGQASPGMLGSGGAANAGNAMMMRAYKLYAAEATGNGDEVIPFEQFQAEAMRAKQEQMQQAQQPQQAQPRGLR